MRGEIIPILDFRIRLGIEPTLTYETAVVICDLKTVVFGGVVDSIQTVISVDDQQIIPFKNRLASAEVEDPIVQQVVPRDGKLILILDVSKVMSASEELLAELRATREKFTNTA